jgi:hypothetical protein
MIISKNVLYYLLAVIVLLSFFASFYYLVEIRNINFRARYRYIISFFSFAAGSTCFIINSLWINKFINQFPKLRLWGRISSNLQIGSSLIVGISSLLYFPLFLFLSAKLLFLGAVRSHPDQDDFELLWFGMLFLIFLITLIIQIKVLIKALQNPSKIQFHQRKHVLISFFSFLLFLFVSAKATSYLINLIITSYFQDVPYRF